MNLNTSERRALRNGQTIVKQKRNSESGDLYWVDVRLSWNRLYFRMPDASGEWFRSAGLARRDAERDALHA